MRVALVDLRNGAAWRLVLAFRARETGAFRDRKWPSKARRGASFRTVIKISSSHVWHYG